MAWTKVNSSAATAVSSPLVLDVGGATPGLNHLLVAAVETGAVSSTPTITTPAGWTLVPSGVSTTNGNTKLALYYKISAGNETAGASFAVSGTPAFLGGFMAEFSGNRSTLPMDIAAASGNTVAATTSATASIAAAVGTLVLAVYGSSTSPVTDSAWTNGFGGSFVSWSASGAGFVSDILGYGGGSISTTVTTTSAKYNNVIASFLPPAPAIRRVQSSVAVRRASVY